MKQALNDLKSFSKKTGMFLIGKKILVKKDLITRIINENKKENKSPIIKNVLKNIPKGATHTLNGKFYKIGSHGFTFIFLDNSWQRCNGLILTNKNKI